MSVLTVVGLQWGDEGKGKIVDWLSGEASHVARFQGGHNAGHTLINQGKKTVLHLLPSGVLKAEARCYVGSGVVISPTALLAEIRRLEADGIILQGRLFVADNAALVLPYHVDMDCVDADKIGTTKRGIGPAHEDKVGRRALRLYDLYNGMGKARLTDNVAFYNYRLARHSKPPLSVEVLWETLSEQAVLLRPYLCDDIGHRLAQAKSDGDNILLEGAQGALLDIEQGTYPFTTSASCLATAAPGGLGVDLSPAVLGVTKSYCTRVGHGPFPTELTDASGHTLTQQGNEFGTTTGRQRRCGWLDIPLLRHAIRINGCHQLAMTKLDVLNAFDTIKICVEYDLDGQRRHFPPSDPALLERCLPVYETLPGWRDRPLTETMTEETLPLSARQYIQRIEALCEISVNIISTGADRQATIVKEPCFPINSDTNK